MGNIFSTVISTVMHREPYAEIHISPDDDDIRYIVSVHSDSLVIFAGDSNGDLDPVSISWEEVAKVLDDLGMLDDVVATIAKAAIDRSNSSLEEDDAN